MTTSRYYTLNDYGQEVEYGFTPGVGYHLDIDTDTGPIVLEPRTHGRMLQALEDNGVTIREDHLWNIVMDLPI